MPVKTYSKAKKAVGTVIMLLCLAFFCTSVCGCEARETFEEVIVDGAEQLGIIKVDKNENSTESVKETKSIYADDDDDSVITMYLTVQKGNKTENANHTWAEVNSYSTYYYKEKNIARYAVYGILQQGDDNGVLQGEFGYSSKTPNCVVQVRGATTSRAVQKSYKISLMDSAGEWRGQTTIALNKHIYDRMRFTNKLAFDFIKEIPDMIGLRTQFVHLYVCDQSEDTANTLFEDYGLFTQVEQPNKTFLKNHGLNSEGQLYKATAFEFQLYDELKLATDPDYSETAFEEILEIKGSDDHTKLLAMLADINDYSKNIKEVFEKHFDADNYFTWLAFNILTANIDTQSQNFLLYSPLNSDKWYFIPWDCDGAFKFYWRTVTENRDTGYETGVSTYWGSVLHSRVLSDGHYRQQLDEKINEVMKIMTEEAIRQKIESYAPIIKKYSFVLPDSTKMGVTEDEWESIMAQIPYEIKRNYEQYLLTLEMPMPFFIGVPDKNIDGDYVMEWGAAFDFDEQNIYYTVEIADNTDFTNPILNQSDIRIAQITLPKIAAGVYFVRVRAVDEDGYEQFAFDSYRDVNSIVYRGTKMFTVDNNGIITMD